jgi:hypothetical protein
MTALNNGEPRSSGVIRYVEAEEDSGVNKQSETTNQTTGASESSRSLLIAQAKKITEESGLNPEAKDVAMRLLDHFGMDWWSEFANAEDVKGPGTSGISFGITIEMEGDEGDGGDEDEDNWKPDPLDLYDEFIFNSEDFEEEHEEDLDEEGFAQHSPVTAFLHEWKDQRISYRRSVLNEKLPEARWKTSAELDEVDFGGLEGACRTCGKVFYDNFGARVAEEAFYCSLPCIGRAEFECMECGEYYEVGVGSNRENRRRRLSGWCSSKCETPWIDADEESRGWVAAMVRRARELDREFDSDITRRRVFERAKGVCHYCGISTKWKADERFAPDLGTVDHVLPWEKGGNHTWDNVVLACWLCNAMKGTRLEFESRGSRESWRRKPEIG